MRTYMLVAAKEIPLKRDRRYEDKKLKLCTMQTCLNIDGRTWSFEETSQLMSAFDSLEAFTVTVGEDGVFEHGSRGRSRVCQGR